MKANPKGLLDPLYKTMVFMATNDTDKETDRRINNPEMLCDAIVDATPIPLEYKTGGTREVLAGTVRHLLYAYLELQEYLS